MSNLGLRNGSLSFPHIQKLFGELHRLWFLPSEHQQASEASDEPGDFVVCSVGSCYDAELGAQFFVPENIEGRVPHYLGGDIVALGMQGGTLCETEDNTPQGLKGLPTLKKKKQGSISITP